MKNKTFISLISLLLFTGVSIMGCGSDSGPTGSRVTKRVLTENDFADDPSLECDAEVDTCITFLESPFSNGVESDTGEIGIDIIPINFRSTVNLTLCWEDDNEDAEHIAMLVNSEGSEILFLQTNNDCVSVIVEAGKHELIFAHDEKTEEETTVYLRPINNGDSESNGSVLNFIQYLVSKAFAQTPTNLEVLLRDNACPKCDLKGVNLNGKDISFDDITGAMLNGASMIGTQLYQTKIGGADFTDADLSSALWIDGSTCKPGSTGVGKDNENNCDRGSTHTIDFKNECNNPIWIGAVFAGGKPFLPVNGGPPLWGPGDTPSWQIPAGGSRPLVVPFGWTSGNLAFRTGCTGSGDTLKCQVGGCGGFLNCGTKGKGADNSTIFEITMDGAGGSDFYNASMVAAFHVLVTIEPSVATCLTVGVCKDGLPKCPWDKFVREAGQDTKFRQAGAGEIGVCLKADVMVASQLSPFKNIIPGSKDDFKLRCGCPKGGVCGDQVNCKGFFGCSPFTPISGNKSGCLPNFFPTGMGGTCDPSKCPQDSFTKDFKFSKDQICDPYGQCDAALNRDARWPFGCTSETTPCPSANLVDPTKYIENIKEVCGEFPMVGAPYSWQFDDPSLPGLAGALATCTQSGGGVNYIVTISCN